MTANYFRYSIISTLAAKSYSCWHKLSYQLNQC